MPTSAASNPHFPIPPWPKLLVASVFFIGSIGCEEVNRISSYDPKSCPYVFAVDETYPTTQGNIYQDFLIHDLNGDGEDEIVQITNVHKPGQHLHTVIVKNADHKTSYQLNFPDTIRIGPLPNATFLDVDRNGIDEIFLTVQRNDSLFVVVGNFVANSRKEIFLAVKPDTISSTWDCGVGWGSFLDVNNDRRMDLLCYLYAQQSKVPRGIFAYDIKTGRRLWSCPFGAVPSGLITVADLNGDGAEELLVPTFSLNNGANANGIDDSHSYVLAIRKSGDILWAREFGGSGTYTAANAFTNADGKRDVAVIFSGYNPKASASSITLLDGASGSTLRTVNKPGEMLCTSTRFVSEQRGKERLTQMFVANVNGRVEVYDASLQIIRSEEFRPQVPFDHGCVMLDEIQQAGFPFNIEVTTANNQTLFLDQNLNIVAVFDGPDGVVQPVRGRTSNARRLALISGNNWYLATLEANRFYLLYRYKYLGFLALLAVVSGGVWATRRFNFYYWLYIQLLRRSEAEGIIVIGKRGELVHVNETALSILSLQRKSARRLPWQEALNATQFSELRSFIQRSARSDRSEREQFTLSVGDTTKHVVCSIAPIRGLFSRKLGWLVLVLDVTKTIEHDRVLNWAAVARNLAHEMKNPLGTILLNTEYLREQLLHQIKPSETSSISKLEAVRGELIKLNDYLKNFMKVANLQPPNFLTSNVNEVLSDILRFYDRRKPESVTISTHFADSLPSVLLDVNLFTSALINLLDNAVQAMAGTGTIMVRTSLAQELNPERAVLEIAVEDTGCGISPEDAPKIFQPFFTKSRTGTGLGLVITKKIMEDHGGTLSFTSEVGKGTQFSIRIPAAGSSGASNA